MNTTREESQRSIMQMCRGAFQERVDYEMPRLIENILDPNTSPTKIRSLRWPRRSPARLPLTARSRKHLHT